MASPLSRRLANDPGFTSEAATRGMPSSGGLWNCKQRAKHHGAWASLAIAGAKRKKKRPAGLPRFARLVGTEARRLAARTSSNVPAQTYCTHWIDKQAR